MRHRRHLLTEIRQLSDGRFCFDDYWSTGKRVQVRRRTRQEAAQARTELSVLIANGRRDLVSLGPAELAEFRDWKAQRDRSETVAHVITAFLAHQNARGSLNPHVIKRTGHFLTSLQERYGSELISQVDRDQLNALLSGLGKRPRHRNNIRAAIVQLFRYAREQELLPDMKRTEAEKTIRLKITKAAEITLWTAEEMRALLEHAPADFLPWYAIGGFAGVRTEELMPRSTYKPGLAWEDIDWRHGVIHVRQETAKNNTARDVPLLPNLAEWLRPYQNRTGPVIPKRPGTHKITLEMKERTGLEHRRNALRHSFATYRMALVRNAFQVSEEMGNHPSDLKSNYQRPRMEHEAAAWFGLIPAKPAKVKDYMHEMKLWILETDRGTKRSHARNKTEALKKMEKHGLTVLEVRAGTDKDYEWPVER